MALDVPDAGAAGGDLLRRALLHPGKPALSRLEEAEEKAARVLTSLFGAACRRSKLKEIRTASATTIGRAQRHHDAPAAASSAIRKIVWVGIMLAVFQQLVGINVIFYYGSTLWQLAGFTEQDSLMINIVSGAVSIAACFATIALIDKIGRKPLLLIGSAGMASPSS
jgi:SP family sugar:H+ symporter-like MFS transporter